MGRMIDMTEGEAEYLKYRFKQYLGSVNREIQNRRLKNIDDTKRKEQIKFAEEEVKRIKGTDKCELKEQEDGNDD